RDHYSGEFNSKFMVAAAETGIAFAPIHRQDLDRVFAIQQERTVGNDNTIQFANHVWQIPSTPFRATLAGCRVIVYEHLDATFSVGYGPHTVARFTASGDPVRPPSARATRKNRSYRQSAPPLTVAYKRSWREKSSAPALHQDQQVHGPAPALPGRTGTPASPTPATAAPHG